MIEKCRQFFTGPAFRRLIKFGITGVANTLIDLVVFTVLRSGLAVNLYLAKTAGYLCGMLNSYIVNRRWTFQTKSDFLSIEFLKFILLNLAMLGVSYGFLYLFADLCALPDWFANILTTGLVMLISFCVNNLWVFRNKRG